MFLLPGTVQQKVDSSRDVVTLVPSTVGFIELEGIGTGVTKVNLPVHSSRSPPCRTPRRPWAYRAYPGTCAAHGAAQPGRPRPRACYAAEPPDANATQRGVLALPTPPAPAAAAATGVTAVEVYDPTVAVSAAVPMVETPSGACTPATWCELCTTDAKAPTQHAQRPERLPKQ